MTKFSDASKRAISSRLWVERSASTTTTGTSRTSVCASNGVRETVESFVGYPKDPVARKLLKKDVLFGEEAREKRLSLNLFRPLEHGVLKYNQNGKENAGDLRAAEDLIREIIRRAKSRKD